MIVPGTMSYSASKLMWWESLRRSSSSSRYSNMIQFRWAQENRKTVYLFMKTQHPDDNSQYQGRGNNGDGDPRYPLARSQEKLSLPFFTLFSSIWRRYHEFWVRYDTFHIDIMICCMLGRSDKKILDIIVGTSESKKGIRSEKWVISWLRKLSHYLRHELGYGDVWVQTLCSRSPSCGI